ncbi:Ig-like domain-containing protein [Curtobacterium sp. YR515]|uniref:Ig-like domain-containing protein n=1 Tax=Curtobacterium sp. YR515 TaxID=1855316 RepID=UPI0008DFD9E9|nr:Ig-like domain-containing protein [Curtobacterium sp. YR515]SFF44413.1 hypothetical protein SAMN05216329_0823 [Curtobacterium sp. YR515]
MSSKKKRIAKGLGASALAVATLASGLSFGATGATAAATSASTINATFDPNDLESNMWGKMYGVFPTFNTNKETEPSSFRRGHVGGTWTAVGVKWSTAGHFTSTAAEAEEAAGLISLPEVGKWQRLMVRADLNHMPSCLRYANPGGGLMVSTATLGNISCRAGDENQLFTRTADGKIVPYLKQTEWIDGAANYWNLPRDSTNFNFHVGKGDPLNLPWDGKPIGDQTELAGSVEFAAGVDARAVVKGSTEASGRVEVRRGETVIASGDANADGDYSIAIPAPDKAGDDELTVALVENNEDKKTIKVTAAYGAGVAITAPGNNENVSGQYEIRGNAQNGSNVTVRLNNGAERAVEVNGNGQWSTDVTLPMGETTITATQKSKGANTTTSKVTVNPGESSVPAPEAQVVFNQDVTQRATITGSAQNGASIEILDSNNTVVGRPQVVNGQFSQTITAPGAGVHEYTVTQTVDGDTSEATKVAADFGAAVALTSPEGQVAPGMVEVTGTTQAGAKVTVEAAGKTADATVTGTTWSASIEIAPSTTPVQITATQTSKGALTTKADTTVTTDGPQELLPVTITGPGTYTNGQNARVHGKASPFAEITLEAQWGPLTQKGRADVNGDWEIWRGFGPDVAYTLTATQNLTDGQSSKSATHELRPEGTDPSAGVEITGPADGRFDPTRGNRITGTAAPNATISLRAPWGELVSGIKANGSGQWEVSRGFGNMVYFLTAEQTRTDNSKSVSPEFVLKPIASQTSPVAITGPRAGYEYPGATTVTGIASPGASVTISSQWDELRTVTADEDGNWSFNRGFGPDTQYKLKAVQTRIDDSTTESPVFDMNRKTNN